MSKSSALVVAKFSEFVKLWMWMLIVKLVFSSLKGRCRG